MAYRWQHRGRRFAVGASVSGPAQPLVPGSEAEFITEHYWGYTRQRDGGTLEYEVAHPRWAVWTADAARFEGAADRLYGPDFAPDPRRSAAIGVRGRGLAGLGVPRPAAGRRRRRHAMIPPMTEPVSVQRDGYTVSNDPARLDVDAIHAYLTRSYWAAGIPRATVAQSLAHSAGLRALRPGRRPGRLHARHHRLDHVRLPLRRLRPRGPPRPRPRRLAHRDRPRRPGPPGPPPARAHDPRRPRAVREIRVHADRIGRFMDKTIPDVYQGRVG